MASPPAQGQCRGHPGPPPARAPDPLLVVEPDGRHVCEANALEPSDVDAGFHRRRDAEQVDPERQADFVLHEDLLEATLPQPSIRPVRLAGQLLAVQPEGRLRAPGEEFVKVLGRVQNRMPCGARQRRPAARAHAPGPVQVRPAAAGARADVDLVVWAWARTDDVHVLHDDPPVALVERRPKKVNDVLLEAVRIHSRPSGDGLEEVVAVRRHLRLPLDVRTPPATPLREHPHQ